VLDNVQQAAERTWRVFFIQYDTGFKLGSEWSDVLEADWLHQLSCHSLRAP
jgi:hypothetical protein